MKSIIKKRVPKKSVFGLYTEKARILKKIIFFSFFQMKIEKATALKL